MTEQQLNELSIFSLRELARRSGVSSPTSKKKNQLINEILAITAGVQKPHIAKTKQGRPPKTFGYDMVVNRHSGVGYNHTTLTLKQTCAEFQVGEEKTVTGVVEIVDNGSGFLWVNNKEDYICCYLTNVLIAKWGLLPGDKVLALVEKENNQIIIKEILNINGFPALKFNKNRIDYYQISHVADNELIDFGNTDYAALNVKKGENVYVYGQNNNENTNYAINLLNSSNVKHKLYINVSIVEKNKHILDYLNNVDLFVSKLTDTLDSVRRNVALAIERAMRILEQGQDVLVVVDDALSVAGIDLPDLPMLKKLVSITKKAKEGSITIVAIMDKEKQIPQIEKLADKKIEITP